MHHVTSGFLLYCYRVEVLLHFTFTISCLICVFHFRTQMANMANLANYSLAMMSNVAGSVIEHAKMHIDWMNDKVAK